MSTVVGKLAVEIGVNDAQLQTGLNNAANAAQAAGQKMQQSVAAGADKAAGSTANMGRAILQASRGIQDFQAAGLNGIINNVEGIASAFGVGAGVAGAATLAAVAIQSLTPLIQNAAESTAKFFGLWRSETDTFKDSVTGMMGGGDALKGLAEIKSKQAEFLQNRSDKVGGFNIDFVSRAVGLGSNDENALANNMRRSAEAAALMQESFRLAADASRELAVAQRAASAKYDLTTNQKEETRQNQQLFQAAIDKYGGGDNLRTKIEQAGIRDGMKKTDADQLYGKFATGDIAATKRVEELVNLGEERAKVAGEAIEKNMQVIADQFKKEQAIREKAIEEEARSLEENMNYLKGVAKRRDRLEEQRGNIKERIDDLMNQRARSEVVGASAVFEKNLNAGMEDPVVKAIEKQTEELKQVTKELAVLG